MHALMSQMTAHHTGNTTQMSRNLTVWVIIIILPIQAIASAPSTLTVWVLHKKTRKYKSRTHLVFKHKQHFGCVPPLCRQLMPASSSVLGLLPYCTCNAIPRKQDQSWYPHGQGKSASARTP
ncbi:hypothetical protein COO60DRAFT_1487836 [Scenedesmus sp. NREL 46B-D3]|nr:hypothetical protein COO60DRAFT_1487836 [Scenedesmus sp. NREL 46B-D3]